MADAQTGTNLSEMLKMEIDDSYPSSFQCCVCLDLLYKPVVLACGHISCFWCVHKAMHGLRASHCAICRQPYIYFPGICQLLHHLLLKMEPVAYKRREIEVLEEEKRLDIFSPQFGNPVISGGQEEMEISSEDANLNQNINIGKPSFPENTVENGMAKQLSVDDVLCELCKELLYQPGVLNCGHVFCKPCLSGLHNEPLKCPVCLKLHPGEFPDVCLDFDHFLSEQFPREHAARKEKVLLKRDEFSYGESSSSGLHEKQNGEQAHVKKGDYFFSDKELRDVHYGVGCDSCGMFPIYGKRYRCTDCKEAIGFDLCESCYNSSSKFPGRFNQQHTPDHKFEIDESKMLCRILFRSLAVDGGDQDAVVFLPDDGLDADIPDNNGDDNDDINEREELL